MNDETLDRIIKMLDVATTKVSDLQEQLKIAHNSIDAQRDENQHVRSLNAKSGKSVHEFQVKLDETQSQLAEKCKEVDNLNGIVNEQREAIINLHKTIKEQRTKLDTKEFALTPLSISQNIADKEKQIADKEKQVKELQEVIKIQGNTIVELKSDLAAKMADSIQIQQGQQKQELIGPKPNPLDNNKPLYDTIADLEKKLAEAEKNLKEANAHQQNLATKVSEIWRKNQELEKENQVIKDQLNFGRGEWEKLCVRLRDHRRLIKRLASFCGLNVECEMLESMPADAQRLYWEVHNLIKGKESVGINDDDKNKEQITKELSLCRKVLLSLADVDLGDERNNFIRLVSSGMSKPICDSIFKHFEIVEEIKKIIIKQEGSSRTERIRRNILRNKAMAADSYPVVPQTKKIKLTQVLDPKMESSRMLEVNCDTMEATIITPECINPKQPTLFDVESCGGL